MQQHGDDLRKLPAGEGALQRAVRVGLPASHQRRDFERLAKTHFEETIERLRIVGLRRKREVGPIAALRKRLLEQTGIMALHIAQMQEQRLGERIAIAEAAETGETIEAVAFR